MRQSVGRLGCSLTQHSVLALTVCCWADIGRWRPHPDLKPIISNAGKVVAQTMLPTRAFENGVFLAYANSAGIENGMEFFGTMLHSGTS